ncbi:glycoside hydrolase family 5 protein [Streptomyces sp. A3M-1-3]|uniref:glycoside hydrolase family 5 protein n=1 Tax=Streptomyces sp. A3M-1-3 TaxID=2962044 RepID=UPI0020B7AA99|nr:glycoside hydrolase family 5 protein [Streptomyces sp. A3M-1-3]MCP3819925.1 glycoside hydrolase family 5 protein [Streptomyces sp. A3M-1-3]
MATVLGLFAVNTARGEAIGAAAGARTPVGTYGKVRVCGTQLCSAAGKPVQLRGMSTHGTQWYPHCLVNRAMDAFAYDWKASVLRISTYAREGGYEKNPKKFTDLASQLVDRASARGMYVIVDWHTLNPGDPNADIANAKAFFKEIAKRHKRKSNVLYEIANEPNHVNWSTIKSYAEKVIPVIRALDRDSVILVPTPGWSTLGLADGSNEQAIVDDPVRATNIMYTFHFYAPKAGEPFLKALDRASSRLPVFVTEWGTTSWTGYGNDFPMSQRYTDLMKKKKIGWTNWSISDNAREFSVFNKGVCSGRTFAGTRVLKPAGAWVRNQIRG